ncbi:PREDICTED: leucine-rich repeat receptor protein kinase EMS1-like isoform X1 [Nelumbo nucifera]|uniref:non-specific serine/threonine protein kinase n=3 Tax=Nelumbo nucifera TaxID=4432 RepID=A0A1U7ZJ35_NELNU|nr:PREDICTED: leucine-rich repeat receptor protein kinase EMS1-like isoform X1 [Nelumbo nucifera]DAD26777.1 TPA_asm: hypothetical protein HUJ06_028245 [Nelumbo nucifera]
MQVNLFLLSFKMASASSMLSLFLVISLCSSELLSASASDLQALMAFKSVLRNPEGIADWGEGPSPCTWTGITCGNGSVVSISLPHLGLQGTLPLELGSLSNLELLDLADNEFSGPLPPRLWKLKKLKTLNLSFNLLNGTLSSDVQNLEHLQKLILGSNSLSGKLDPAICSCLSLEILDLGANSFTGEIPNQISYLSKLQVLVLGGNGLSGPIPSSIGELFNLVFLDLGDGFLSGSIPTSLWQLEKLQSLDLSNNSISGPIPSIIGRLSALRDLHVGHNRFEGALPRDVGNLKNLRNLDAPSCGLTGPIPDEIGNLQSLEMLDLSINPLQSQIPPSIGKLQNLTILNLISAAINGSIPPELGNCRKLKTVILTFNDLSGPLPDKLAGLSDSIISFSIERNHISGQLPPWFGRWVSADSILLASNEFHGTIPSEFGNCTSLTYLTLSHNQLTGNIPSELCNCKFLSELDLENNLLTGMINDTFRYCQNLTQLILVQNRLTGAIPAYLSDLPLLSLELDYNKFYGEIPVEIWSSNSLMEFSAGFNFLGGTLSPRIGGLVTLQRLILNDNRLEGRIPKEIGELRDLLVLSLNHNQLSGEIPRELFRCRSLMSLDLGFNKLNGSIPREIRNLTQLEFLVLSHNHLSGDLPLGITEGFRQPSIPETSYFQHRGVFDLSGNLFSGKIPQQLGNCIVIVDLILGNNNFSGDIPPSIFKLPNLTSIDLSSNQLEGKIPNEVGDPYKLQGLDLAYNRFHGEIPTEIGKLKNLVKLNLSGNLFTGSVPASIGNLGTLSDLDLSNNHLSGMLPLSLSMLTKIVGLYLQQNQITGDINGVLMQSGSWRQIQTLNLSLNLLSGEVPSSIANLSYLNYLDLHNNRFTGTITRYLGNLSQLMYLDMSNNLFHGQIPQELCDITDLNFLNLSNNQLWGPVLNCGKFTGRSFLNNSDLCGSSVGRICKFGRRQRRRLLDTPAILILSLSTSFSFFCLFIVFLKWKTLFQDSMKPLPKSMAKTRVATMNDIGTSFEQPLLQLTLSDILHITNNFSKLNVIGDGGSGTVYRGILPDGRMVAIKKLGKARDQGSREFQAEMEAIGKVKHKNLVPLLGYCSFEDNKILIFEFMANGSLESWLRNKSESLNVLSWNKRLKIATGTARGLAFLHHGVIPRVIHRDVKASNILLDQNFEARVSDFGLARVVSAYDTHVTTEIAGTFGYIAPEYAQSWRSTTKGDVYSFGVILLEMVTGKEPTGICFKDVEGGNLVGWVREMVTRGKSVESLDGRVSNGSVWVAQMVEVLHLGLVCTSEDPMKRPSMLEVVKFLEDIGGE